MLRPDGESLQMTGSLWNRERGEKQTDRQTEKESERERARERERVIEKVWDRRIMQQTKATRRKRARTQHRQTKFTNVGRNDKGKRMKTAYSTNIHTYIILPTKLRNCVFLIHSLRAVLSFHRFSYVVFASSFSLQLTQILKILNVHHNSLQWIENGTARLNHDIADISRKLQQI